MLLVALGPGRAAAQLRVAFVLTGWPLPPASQFLTIGRLIGNSYRLWSRKGPLAGELRGGVAAA